MSTVNEKLIGNNPVWSDGVVTMKINFALIPGPPTTLGIEPAALAGKSITHVMLSNTGAVNIHVGTSAVASTGILLQPGGSLSVAVDATAVITVNGALAIFDLLLFP